MYCYYTSDTGNYQDHSTLWSYVPSYSPFFIFVKERTGQVAGVVSNDALCIDCFAWILYKFPSLATRQANVHN